MASSDNFSSIQAFNHHETGFSLVELIIVMLVISILAVLSLMSFKSEKKHFVDRQALVVMDLLNEAKQRALTQHETMRVEINKTKKTISLITENTAGNASDDQVIKSLPLQDQYYITFDKAPTNAIKTPVDSAPVPTLTFSASTHPLSLSDQVATFRFTQTGTVLNAGSNSVGANAVSTGATLYFWLPNYSSSGQALTTGNVMRAITLLGSTGTTKYWKCPVQESTGKCKDWEQ